MGGTRDGATSDHEAALDATRQAWEQVVAGDRRFVVLVGPPGIGKTWVVQRLFTALAAGQPAPAYWPPELLDDQGPTLAGRGRILPASFRTPARAAPSFGWVGINAGLDDDVPVRALEVALATAHDQHGPVTDPPGLRARLKLGLWRPLLGALLVLVGVALAVVEVLGRGGLLLTLLGALLLVAELGQLRSASVALRAWWRARGRHRRELDVDGEDLRRASVDEALRLQRRFDEAEIPAVWVVDDLGWADEATVAAIRRLLSSESRVLVVATARPHPLDDQMRTRQGPGALLTQFADRLERIELTGLGPEQLAAVVHGRAPATEPAVIHRLASWSGGNPLVLRGLLEMEVMASRLVDGAFRWELDELDRLLAEIPPSVDEVFGVYFDDLPASVRRLLACAVVQGAQVHGESLCASSLEVVEADPAGVLAQARHPYAWLHPVDRHLDRFADPALLSIAERRAGQILDGGQRDTVRQQLLEHVAQLRADPDRWHALPTQTRMVLLRVRVVAAQDGTVDPDLAAATYALELAHAEHAPDEARRSARHAELAADWARDLDRGVWLSASMLAIDRHLASGRGDRAEPIAIAIEVATRGPERAERAANHRARRQLALARGMQGDDDAAVRILEQLAVDHAPVFGPDDPDHLEDLRHLTHHLGRAGRAAEGLERVPDLVQRHEHRLGPRHIDTLVARSIEAYLVGEARGPEAAIERYESLVADRAEALGPLHPDTLWSRNNLAGIVGRAGQVDRAIELLEAVVADRSRVLGLESPHTLKSRENLTRWLHAAQRHDEAAAMVRSLVRESTEVLGPTHPATRRTVELAGDIEAAARP